MSVKLSSLVWGMTMPPTLKLVLLALCDWANDSGYCFPSVLSIAKRGCISKRQSQRIMGELISMALVNVVGNQQGGAGSRRYQINLAAIREGNASGVSPVTQASPAPATARHKSSDTDVARTNSNRQSDPPLRCEATQGFDWSFLPQVSDAQRVVVVGLLDGLGAAQGQDVLDELAGAWRAKAIKAQWPGWLRGVVRHARAGAFVPNHALAIQRDRLRMVREAAEAEARRSEQNRRLDPDARARGLAAMQAAIAEMGLPPKGEKSSS